MTDLSLNCLMSCVLNGKPLSAIPMSVGDCLCWSGINRKVGTPGRTRQGPVSPPHYAPIDRVSALWSRWSWHSALVVAPLAWRVCGQAAAPLLPGTGEEEEGDEPSGFI